MVVMFVMIWLLGQDLKLGPADPAGDCAANAERISGYGACARSYLASGSEAFAPATLAEHVTWYFGEFGCGGRI